MLGFSPGNVHRAHTVRSPCVHLRSLLRSIRAHSSQSAHCAFIKRSPCAHCSFSQILSYLGWSQYMHYFFVIISWLPTKHNVIITSGALLNNVFRKQDFVYFEHINNAQEIPGTTLQTLLFCCTAKKWGVNFITVVSKFNSLIFLQDLHISLLIVANKF